MASWTAGAGSRATLVHTVDVNWQSGNQSSLHVNTYVAVSGGSGITNNVGDANWNVNTAGVSPSSNFTYSGWSNNNYGLNTYDVTVNHDANGYCTVGVHAYVNGANPPFFTAASIDTSLGLPRIALAPSIAAITADTIKPTAARLGAEFNNFGHGTSASFTMYYRLVGSSTWINLGTQGDVGGYNYWNLTGLTPNKMYEYYVMASNNNGDQSTLGTSTFKTKPTSGMIAVLQAVL